MMERSLKQLVEANPEIAAATEYNDICPSRTVGSDIADDYPRQIEQLAHSLRDYARNEGVTQYEKPLR